MFANKANQASNRTATSGTSASIKTFLGEGSEFDGRVTFNENTQIDGTFRGEITSQETLVVGESGKLKAEVSVGIMIINGVFQGTIKASSHVHLKAPAKVKGDITSPRISIEDGVVFDGSIQMSTQAVSTEKFPQSPGLEREKQSVSLVQNN